jgi:hypothetical protein
MRFSDYAVKVETMIASAPRGAAYPQSVAATFDLAIAAAIKHCPAAEQMMACLSQCAPERIPIVLVEGAIDDEAERQAAMLALTEVSLVKNDPFPNGMPAITVHRLVQVVARARLGSSEPKLEAADRIAARLLLIPDAFSDPYLSPHALFAITQENLTPAARKLLQISGWSSVRGLAWCLTIEGEKIDPNRQFVNTLCRNCRDWSWENVRDPPLYCYFCGYSGL